MLTDAGNKAFQAGETIAASLTKLLTEIEGHAAQFQGVAGSAFQNVSAELGQELRRILGALNTMAENVHASNRQFGATDDDASREISSVASQYVPNSSSVADALRG